MTPVGVSDQLKSKFCSLESQVSGLNSALSWNVKLNFFNSQCYIIWSITVSCPLKRGEKVNLWGRKLFNV